MLTIDISMDMLYPKRHHSYIALLVPQVFIY